MEYDADAKVIDSMSDLDSNSASDSETLIQSPNSKDHDVLKDHDEVERLLTKESRLPQLKARPPKQNAAAPKERGRGRRHRRKSSLADGESNAMYEMEEGYKDNSSANTSTDSLLLKTPNVRSSSSLYSILLRWIILPISTVALFAILAFGAYRASSLPRKGLHNSQAFSNGSHVFEPTTILISLDGFRADFLQRGLTPSMNALVASGISPRYMLPSFPSVTFPNHYTLVTGLYPESHGIVGNQFWDPEFQEEFYYTKTEISMQSKWWEKAEPLWVTAEKQGVKTAVHMWPGSEAHIHGIDPTYLDAFNDHEKLPNKVDRLLNLLDMEANERPQLIAAYVPDVDADGHKFGPNSTEIRGTIANADRMLTLLLEGLLQRNLTEIVNLIIVSDHGMATMSAKRMVQLDDLIDMSLVDHLDGWPLRGIRLKNPDRDLKSVYQKLLKAAKVHGTFDVYTRDTMPQRYHFSQNPRIAELWVIPKTGWLVIEKEDFDIATALANGKNFNPIGLHGFDHEHPLMRAIFIARGPAFPHAPNSRVPVFQNTEVYNIVCDSIGITPHSNNGTIRLPFKTEGLHSDFPETLETPSDDPADFDESKFEDDINTEAGVAQTIGDVDNKTISSPTDNPSHSKSSWWDYIHNQLQKAKDWAAQVIDSIKNNNAKTAESPPS